MDQLLKIGDQIRDNDSRMPGRMLKIVELDDAYVRARGGHTIVRIRRNRIFTDGKPRRRGFDLVRDAA